jgi:hypothetical protein
MKSILFTAKQEAFFSCPVSYLDVFTEFLKNENMEILSSKYIGDQSGEKIYMIEVSNNLDASESGQLISNFMKELEGKS